MDETSFLQRLTPLRARSNWSQKNVEHAERLIAQGRMQATGLAHVEAARSDGRWATLKRQQLFANDPREFKKSETQIIVSY